MVANGGMRSRHGVTMPGVIDTAGLRLAPVLDTQAAAPLLQSLLDRRGTDLCLDGGGVQRIGGQCLQVLLAAQAAWAGDRCILAITTPSPDLLSGLALLGVGPQSPLLNQEFPS